MKFHYSAQDRAGAAISGEREAADEFSLARDLRKDGIILVSAQSETVGAPGALSRLLAPLSRASLKDQLQLTGNLSSMLSAGLPLGRSLALLEKQSKSARLRALLSGVNEAIAAGSSLADAFAKYPSDIPNVVVAMVHAGEESGNLPASLSHASENLKKRYVLQRRIRGALAYPLIVSFVMVFVSVIVLVFVVPSITETFKEFGVELPFLTRALIAASSFLVSHPVTLTAATIAAAAAIVAAFRTDRGRRIRDRAVLVTPFVSTLAKESYSAVVTGTLASLLRSGVEIVEAIEITKGIVQNSRYRDMLTAAAERLQKGVSLHAILKEYETLFPPFVGEMTEVGDETGKLPEMLGKVAEFYEEHISDITKNMSTLMEPIMMVGIGLFVGLFALAVLKPLYSLSSIV